MATLPHIAYTDDRGRPRELVVRSGAFGSLLVLDRDPATPSDRRLLAHIPADEPPENAMLVCRLYLADGARRSCRPLHPQDLVCAPREQIDAVGERCSSDGPLCGRLLRHEGLIYDIRPHTGERGEPDELRWSVRSALPGAGPWRPTTLRDVLTAVESYEPMRTRTQRALARHGRDNAPDLSVDALRRELARLRQSAFVLNRGLREAVIDAVERRHVVSMSEVALRCGMVKRDRRGALVGDTTWLARRVGLMPEGGKPKPARWVHSDVLGLIARHGLGISPREVELG